MHGPDWRVSLFGNLELETLREGAYTPWMHTWGHCSLEIWSWKLSERVPHGWVRCTYMGSSLFRYLKSGRRSKIFFDSGGKLSNTDMAWSGLDLPAYLDILSMDG